MHTVALTRAAAVTAARFQSACFQSACFRKEEHMSFVTTKPEMLAWANRKPAGDRVANGGAAEPTATRRFGRCPNRRPRRATCPEVRPNTSVWQETDYDLANQ